jgi:hypothetical protein
MTATYTHAKIEEFLEAVFPLRSLLRIYNGSSCGCSHELCVKVSNKSDYEINPLL